MPKITFVEAGGARHIAEVFEGQSLMEAALDNNVPGILGECGGNCSCATCHVYIDSPWSERVPPPSADEQAMVECALHVQPTSRLGCQVRIDTQLEGMVVNIPESQL
jgi:2Fe-2S ferredoxin